MIPPITKLAIFGIQFGDGTKFEIVHDLPENDFEFLFNWWYSMDLPFSQESFIFFVKLHNPECICVTKAQYDEITEGKVISSTKEEYEAQGAKSK